jgi:transposase-like protein
MDSYMAVDPLAFGFFQSETKDDWIWFMEQLRKSIGVLPRLAVCTDAGTGLLAAVAQVFPWAEQRECFRHMMENMKKRFTGTAYAESMWPAARAYSASKHEYFMSKAFQTNPVIQSWLNERHHHLWARSKFSHDIKCDYINNNLVESWNAWIKPFKDLLLHFMVDAIREK